VGNWTFRPFVNSPLDVSHQDLSPLGSGGEVNHPTILGLGLGLGGLGGELRVRDRVRVMVSVRVRVGKLGGELLHQRLVP